MVLNSIILIQVAKISGDLCQYIACNPQRLSTQQLLHLLFVYPFQQIHRLTICLWNFFCFPPPNHYLSFSSSTSSSSSTYSSDFDIFNDAHLD
ncbi:hypothetical protein Leryth_023575 [Lithospermum erythrorhizon]|nr:hypothetical protein Leryth_023575 [Lithospermum erythrorhizon]